MDTSIAIWPTRCKCGGREAWYMVKNNGWEMLGCICHHTYEEVLAKVKKLIAPTKEIVLGEEKEKH